MWDGRQDGSEAPVYRAINAARIIKGLPRELAIWYWGLLSIPILSAPLPYLWKGILLVLGIIGHGGLAYYGRDDPYWLFHLWRKWRHGDVAGTAYDRHKNS